MRKQFEIHILEFLKDFLIILYYIYAETIPTQLRVRIPISTAKLHKKIKNHEKWISSKHKEGRQLLLFGRSLKNADLRGKDLSFSRFIDCNLRSSYFVDYYFDEKEEEFQNVVNYDVKPDKASKMTTRLNNANLSYCRLEGVIFTSDPQYTSRGQSAADVSGASFIGCSGLYGAQGAIMGHRLQFDPRHPPTVQRWMAGSSFGDFPSWNFISAFEYMRLLAVSNTLAIFLVIYAGLANWYNTQISNMQETLEETYSDDGLFDLISNLQELPLPIHFGNLLIIISILFVLNIIYYVFCPEGNSSRLERGLFWKNRKGIPDSGGNLIQRVGLERRLARWVDPIRMIFVSVLLRE